MPVDYVQSAETFDVPATASIRQVLVRPDRVAHGRTRFACYATRIARGPRADRAFADRAQRDVPPLVAPPPAAAPPRAADAGRRLLAAQGIGARRRGVRPQSGTIRSA